MFEEFISDLKIARQRSGLAQEDAAHLLGISRKAMSRIETGEALPSVREALGLSLLYGRTFESFYAEMMALTRLEMIEALAEMPTAPKAWGQMAERTDTLSALARRLEDESRYDYAA
jgi:DNA-binding XRE family transcriptional regulator